eukprot:1193485-Prorocentrum_minimum.AAC.1
MCATRRRSGAYSHGGPIRRRKRGYILTMDQSDPRVRQLDGCGERLFQTLSLAHMTQVGTVAPPVYRLSIYLLDRAVLVLRSPEDRHLEPLDRGDELDNR